MQDLHLEMNPSKVKATKLCTSSIKINVIRMPLNWWPISIFNLIGAIFDGARNSVWMSREYYLDYGCQYKLNLYPFDTQVKFTINQCYFEIVNWSWPLLSDTSCNWNFILEMQIDFWCKGCNEWLCIAWVGK